MKPIGYINGRFIEDLSSPAVQLEDRGNQFGDGVYEVVKVYGGKAFGLKEHLIRFKRSTGELKIPLKYTDAVITEIIDQLLEKSGAKTESAEALIYWQITRGAYARKHLFEESEPQLSFTIRPNQANLQGMQEGVSVTFKPDIRWGRCDIKSLNLLANILAKQEANDEGFFESILVKDGYAIEGASCNLFCIKNGNLYTAPKSNKILWGITRQKVLDLAAILNIPVVEEHFTPEFLLDAHEAFITSSSIEIMPITKVGDTTIGEGLPGLLTRQLQKAMWEKIEAETETKIVRF